MRWLDWVFRKSPSIDQQTPVLPSSGQSQPSTPGGDFPTFSSHQPSNQNDEFFTLPSHQFYGQSSRSENGRYRVAWGKMHGRRSGVYLLLEGNRILVEGGMIRPQWGQVANNGTFVLGDSKLDSALSGALFAFDVNGGALIRRDFKANIFNIGLSTDGHLAACQTCNSDSEKDSSILAVFDLIGKREIANWVPESGWANSYNFPADGTTICLEYRELGGFQYSLDGNFIDQSGWKDACLTKGGYGTALLMAEGLIKDAGPTIPYELAAKILASIERIEPQLVSADRGWQAIQFKTHGICLEVCGSQQEALNCYDKALALNPKIGVKRRADKLRKLLPPRSN